jgi:hypothetical protein
VFVVPNSLREVEVSSNLLLRDDDPSEDLDTRFGGPPPGAEAGEAAPAAEDTDLADVVDEARTVENRNEP